MPDVRGIDAYRDCHNSIMKLVLIRHTSVDVSPGVCYGKSDVPLSSSFEEEAKNVCLKLQKYSFDRVYTSPLSRCVSLAEYCGFPHAVRDDRLIEMNFGEWEMQNFDDISDPRLQEWYADYMNVAPTGGESAMNQRERFESFIQSLKEGNKSLHTVAAFTHGGILIHSLVLFRGKSYADAFATALPYGSIIELDI